MIRRAFPPVVDAETRLLVLGSLPGEASLAAGRYYAHPRNGFWRLMAAVVGRDLPDMDYEARLEALRSAGIGLWDVVAQAERRGSLDTAIRGAESADLAGLIAKLPRLNTVAFNGATAARLGRRALGGTAGLTLIDLPSSSPAHAAMSLDRKAEIWGELRRRLS